MTQQVFDRASASGWHLLVGCVLLAVCWPLNWLLPGLRTHVLFFPLWLGYILVVDALVYRRRRTSPLTRSRREFALLFIMSTPVWWLFEIINGRTQNWEYLGGEQISDGAYIVLSTLSFSTVMPAIFGTAELVRTFDWAERFARGPRVVVTPRLCWTLFLIGAVMLGLLLAYPRYFYPFVWTSLFFIGEPTNVWLGRRSILTGLQRGDWRTVIALSTGALICGFFWELWNYYSLPKWIYHVPFFSFWHVFEMPLPGYLGYVPFALELYVIAHLMRRRLELCV